METLEQIGIKAKKASRYLAKLGIDEKNKALEAVADALTANVESIIAANEKDLVNAKANGMKPALIDRLTLDVKRINAMADGIRVLTGLEDPVGEVTGMKKRPNGLVIGTKRVPLGVVAIIYESRPNVTADAFGLTFKSGNACILRGGSDSINSNIAIADVIAKALYDNGINPDVINLIKDTKRVRFIFQSYANNWELKMNDYDYEIRESNGYLGHDNSLLDDDVLSFRPYHMNQLNSFSASVDLNTMRLMKDRTTRLVITEKSTSNKVFDINLIDYLAMTNMEDKKIGMQEYFDRQSNYHIVFFLSGSWLAMKIVINGWTVYSQTEGDF